MIASKHGLNKRPSDYSWNMDEQLGSLRCVFSLYSKAFHFQPQDCLSMVWCLKHTCAHAHAHTPHRHWWAGKEYTGLLIILLGFFFFFF